MTLDSRPLPIVMAILVTLSGCDLMEEDNNEPRLSGAWTLTESARADSVRVYEGTDVTWIFGTAKIDAYAWSDDEWLPSACFIHTPLHYTRTDAETYMVEWPEHLENPFAPETIFVEATISVESNIMTMSYVNGDSIISTSTFERADLSQDDLQPTCP